MKTRLLASLFSIALLLPAGLGRSAEAGHGHYHGNLPQGGYYGGGYTAPVYHGPSVHYDRVFHPTYTHWTPGGGVHSHGHYDTVPHYTPGHFDTLHNGHVHGNPWYHH